MQRRPLATVVLAAALLAACASPPPPGTDGWQAVPLPGKAQTRYAWGHKDGRRALHAAADSSASMWRRKLDLAAGQYRDVSFSWWVPHLIQNADPTQADREDAPVRLVFGFAGDTSRLSARNRALFDLAEALTGEQPPYATLMYVWVPQAQPDTLGSVILNPRTDRIRKIVLNAGPKGLMRWQDHRRDLVADFRKAFGEDPGPLLSMAVMTDTDNTRSVAQAWYGPVELH